MQQGPGMRPPGLPAGLAQCLPMGIPPSATLPMDGMQGQQLNVRPACELCIPVFWKLPETLGPLRLTWYTAVAAGAWGSWCRKRKKQ